MARAKMIYVSEEGHQRLKILAARKGSPMGRVVEELVDRELQELADPWLSPEGLRLQESVLGEAWSNPALDVYNDG